MLSTMQDYQLTVTSLLRHGRSVYGQSNVVTFEGTRTRTATFAQVSKRAEKLAQALRALGVKSGDRVGTFCWNTQEHLEAYLAVPAMGAVLHTLNIRLFPDQLVYVANHAEDRDVIVDAGDAAALGARVLRYEDLLGAERPGYEWPSVDERAAAAMCYTSGTTG